jgi:hypothetical protein
MQLATRALIFLCLTTLATALMAMPYLSIQ